MSTQGTGLSPAAAGPPPHAAGAKSGAESRRFGKRRSLSLLFLVAVCMAAAIDWFSATTTRLYVDADSAASQQQGTVWQHFGVRGHEVVPEIITADEAHFTFPISPPSRQTLRFAAHPEGEAAYEIVLVTDQVSRPLASRKIDHAESEHISVPACHGELRFVVDGRIAWFDLRLTRQ